MSKRTHDQGKTPLARQQHAKKEQYERLGKPSDVFNVPDDARPSRVGPSALDPANPGPSYYSTGSSSIQQTPEAFRREFPADEIFRTDYPSSEPLTDMSKAPIFTGRPGQFDQVTTWCEISFLTNSELSQDKSKQAAFFASLFRGQVLTWLSKHPTKDDLLTNYPKLKEAARSAWDKTDDIKRADAARRITRIVQRKSVRAYAMEFTQLADTLHWDDSAKQAMFKRGLKQHIKEALVASDTGDTFDELVTEAERIDDELYSIRRFTGRSQPASSFKGKCNSCGQFGHKARDCKRGSKRDDTW